MIIMLDVFLLMYRVELDYRSLRSGFIIICILFPLKIIERIFYFSYLNFPKRDRIKNVQGKIKKCMITDLSFNQIQGC